MLDDFFVKGFCVIPDVIPNKLLKKLAASGVFGSFHLSVETIPISTQNQNQSLIIFYVENFFPVGITGRHVGGKLSCSKMLSLFSARLMV